MSLINVRNLTFAYDGSAKVVFDNVSFQIDTDWKLGFVGRNGKGKTTFLNLLLGKYEYVGKISSDVGFTYFPFEVDRQDRLVCEILWDICPDAEDWEIIREFSYLQMSADNLYSPFDSLSGGEKTKTLLVGLFLKADNFLLIDEPTNHLDLQARESVAKYLKKKKGYILVSHDRAFLDSCVDHILSINKTDIEVSGGNFSTWFDNFQRRQNFESAQNEKLKKEIDRLSESAARNANWADKVEATKYGNGPVDRGFIGHKAAKMMKRAKSVEGRQRRAIEEKSGLLKNLESADDLKIFPLEYPGAKILEFSGVEVCYGDRKICKPVSFELMQGDRLSLSGINGCGKSSLLKIIVGEDISHTGSFKLSSGVKVSYLPQTSDGISGKISEFAADADIDAKLFRTILSKMGFEGKDFASEEDVSTYSQGQKKKIMIARSLCQRAHLYVWDEPLNYLDVYARMQIERLLVEFAPTMIFVEHDEAFVNGVATGRKYVDKLQ